MRMMNLPGCCSRTRLWSSEMTRNLNPRLPSFFLYTTPCICKAKETVQGTPSHDQRFGIHHAVPGAALLSYASPLSCLHSMNIQHSHTPLQASHGAMASGLGGCCGSKMLSHHLWWHHSLSSLRATKEWRIYSVSNITKYTTTNLWEWRGGSQVQEQAFVFLSSLVP